MIFKFAFRNVIRLPWRTLLYFFIIFFVVLAMTASIFVYRACLGAEKALDEDYIFVASLIPKEQNSLTVEQVMLCLHSTDVSAYNVSMSEANMMIPGGESMTKAPSAVEKGKKVDLWMENHGCDIIAVENLPLVYGFFSGECTMRDGQGFTNDGYAGNAAEIVIPWWLADDHRLSVGDTILRRYENRGKYVFAPCEIVGIYETANKDAKQENYPAYIPLAIAEFDLQMALSGTIITKDTIHIDRADFVLESRDEFNDFVNAAIAGGIDQKKSDFVFNNSIYDVLSSELDNISMIVLFVMGTMLLVGMAIFIFFTIYLYTSREKEKELLKALGMPNHKVHFMMLAEHGAIFILALLLGVFGGRTSADGVCSYVNDTVLKRASASEELRLLESSADFDMTMPLERNMRIEISPSETKVSTINATFNMKNTVGEDEIGISAHSFYVLGTGLGGLDGIWDREWLPVDLIGLTNMDHIPTSIPYEEIQNLPKYHEGYLYAFVSENSPYLPAPEKGETILFLTSRAKDSFVILQDQVLADTSAVVSTYIKIIGTYEENPYYSENDILILMDDFHSVYREMSILEDIPGDEAIMRFERIHTVLKKED